MSITITQPGDGVGLTVESDPLAAKKANNLNDLQSASDARTNLGLAYATNTEAQAGASGTTVVTPASLQYTRLNPTFVKKSDSGWAFSTSGTGATAAVNANAVRAVGPTTAIGYAISSFAFPASSRGSSGISTPLAWNKPFRSSIRLYKTLASSDTNNVVRVCFGKQASGLSGDIAGRGCAIKFAGNGFVQLQVHDGTTLTTVSTTTVLAVSTWTDLRINSDGLGNFTLLINDVVSATTSGGPTTASGINANYISLESENLAVVASPMGAYISDISLEFDQ